MEETVREHWGLLVAAGSLIVGLVVGGQRLRSALRSEIHEANQLWIGNGGGKAIASIVGGVFDHKIREHEQYEDRKMREALKEVHTCSDEVKSAIARHDERLRILESMLIGGEK